MKYIRFAIYAGVIGSVILAWEHFREDVFALSTNDNGHVLDEKEIVTEAKADESEKKPIEQKDTTIVDKKQEKLSEEIEISFTKGFADVAKKAMHSVVNVATMQLLEQEQYGFPDIFNGPFEELFKDFFEMPKKKKLKPKKATALGSGFIVQVSKDDVFIVTNNHVVEKAKKVVVYLSDKTELPAEIYAVDTRTDIAVLRVELKDLNFDKSKMKAVEWGDSASLEEGNFVIAIGNPFGFGSTVTHGIISAKGRNLPFAKTATSFIDDYIQHSAPINMGNSGGCLLDVFGKVIGINNAIFSSNGGNIGIGFAIPSNIAKTTVDQLIKHKRTFRGWLGAEVHLVNSKLAESVGLTEHTLDTSKIFGSYVAKLVPNGPAEKAGIKVGDIIIEFNGKKISETCNLQVAVSSAEIGKPTKAKVWRQKDDETWGEVEITVEVGDFEQALKDGSIDGTKEDSSASNGETDPKDVEIECLGITVSKITNKQKSKYPEDVKVIVTQVDEDAGMSFFGPIFMPGDGIISANNKKIASPEQFKKVMDELAKNKSNKNRQIPFVISRGESRMMIATTIDFSKENEKNEVPSNKKDYKNK